MIGAHNKIRHFVIDRPGLAEGRLSYVDRKPRGNKVLVIAFIEYKDITTIAYRRSENSNWRELSITTRNGIVYSEIGRNCEQMDRLYKIICMRALKAHDALCDKWLDGPAP